MTWNRQTVEDKVVAVFVKHRQSDVEITPSTKIIADLGIDSLGVMEVMAEIEDEFKQDKFKLLIPDEALKSIETVGHVIAAITERLEQNGKLSE
ncbi:MAG TPA: phosphopantetheine-binding protein [Polyangium sp.]|nr:phosphopantetheine-binding protein [Polyangium sp.]